MPRRSIDSCEACSIGHNPQDRYSANKTIEELGPAGAPFLHYVIAELRAPGPIHKVDMIDVLKAVGSTEAIAAARSVCQIHRLGIAVTRHRSVTRIVRIQRAGKQVT